MGDEREIVYLVDGSSYIHRAYHAVGNLSNSKGLPTNAILVFARMILKLLADKEPRYLAIVFDAKGPTFRHNMYAEYKANRPPMPESLSIQVPFIKKIVSGLNLKMMEMEGYEADDIIGTLARVSEEKGFRVVMVTGDKDFRQLITPDISMWDPMKDAVIDYWSLKESYGLEPEKFTDVMGLAGDSSDNIPGVPGVGEKTAVGLVREFGSLENVLERAKEVKKKKQRENLQNSQEEALLSKKLVTINRFVPVEEDIEQLKIGEPDKGELSDLFRELEFRGLWERFAGRQEEARDYRLCLSREALMAMVEKIKEKGRVSVDTETTSQDPLRARLVGMSFSWEEGMAYYLPLAHDYEGAPAQLNWSEVLEIIRGVLEDERIAIVGQNIKYDAEVLKRSGVELRGLYFDTMIASYVINPGLRQHNLNYLAQHYLNYKMISYEDVVGKGKGALSFSEVPVDIARDYACEDADITLRLVSILEERLRSDRNDELFNELEMKLLPVLMDMEMAGIKIDTDLLAKMSARFAEEIKQIQKDIYEDVGMEFNINSPQQLGYVLFEKLRLPQQKRTAKTKAYSTDVKVLKKLSMLPHKTPKLLLQYRTLSKLKSTYLDALVNMVNPTTNRIHTSFNQTVTATGRLSSSNPNLQNIPVRGEEGREIRKGFVAGEGHYLLSADYSQVELRIFAHYSRDPALIGAFKNEQDVHSRTASEILGVRIDDVTPDMRRIAKAINFGIIYGMGPQRLSEELEIDGKTARNYIEAYYKRYPGVVRYRAEAVALAREKGYVTTLFNRRRYLPEIRNDKQRIRAEAERMAINTPIQGTAADLIKKSMINIHARIRREDLKTKMLLQVHDELVFEVPEDELEAIPMLVKQEMEGVHELDVPLKVDVEVGRNWGEIH